MIIFGLSTQPAPGVMEITLINNTSMELKVEYSFGEYQYDDERNDKQIINIEPEQTVTLEKLNIRNSSYYPRYVIWSFKIFNNEAELTKKTEKLFDWEEDDENEYDLYFKQVDHKSKRNVSFYTYSITEELIE